MRMEITGISRQKEDSPVRARGKFMTSDADLLRGPLHLHLNEIQIVDI